MKCSVLPTVIFHSINVPSSDDKVVQHLYNVYTCFYPQMFLAGIPESLLWIIFVPLSDKFIWKWALLTLYSVCIFIIMMFHCSYCVYNLFLEFLLTSLVIQPFGCCGYFIICERPKTNGSLACTCVYSFPGRAQLFDDELDDHVLSYIVRTQVPVHVCILRENVCVLRENIRGGARLLLGA